MMLTKFASPALDHRIKKFRNIRGKLLKCNFIIYFNKPCIYKTLVPKYAHVKFMNPHPLHSFTRSELENYNNK